MQSYLVCNMSGIKQRIAEAIKKDIENEKTYKDLKKTVDRLKEELKDAQKSIEEYHSSFGLTTEVGKVFNVVVEELTAELEDKAA